MKITLLGTGCPEPNPRRASSGYLVEVGNDCILLDCGGGVFDRLVQAGKLPSEVTHLFFSHLHSDHMMDYARLIHAAWDESGRSPQVFGPSPIGAIHEKLFGSDGVFATDLRARTEHPGSQEVWLARGGTLPRPLPATAITEITPGFTFNANGWRLSSCAVPHAQPLLTCMALRIDAPGQDNNNASFVYSGDAALCPELEALARDADLLVHWCYRLGGDDANTNLNVTAPDAAQIAVVARNSGVRSLILTHLRVAMDNQAAKIKMKQAAAQHFAGSIAVAEDLMSVEL